MANAVAATQAGTQFVGSIVSILAARKLRQQSDEFRRAARDTEGKAISFAQQNFLDAQNQADQFSSIIADTVDAFSNVSLDDIRSGRAASFQSEPVIDSINQSAQEQTRKLDQDLAKRGIGSDAVGQIERGEIERERGSLITQEKVRSTREETQDRLALTNVGLRQGDQLISAGQPVLDTFAGRINRLSGLSDDRLAASKSAGSGGIKSLVSGASSLSKLF